MVRWVNGWMTSFPLDVPMKLQEAEMTSSKMASGSWTSTILHHHHNRDSKCKTSVPAPPSRMVFSKMAEPEMMSVGCPVHWKLFSLQQAWGFFIIICRSLQRRPTDVCPHPWLLGSPERGYSCFTNAPCPTPLLYLTQGWCNTVKTWNNQNGVLHRKNCCTNLPCDCAIPSTHGELQNGRRLYTRMCDVPLFC